MKKFDFKKFITGCAIGLVLLVAITSGAIADRLFGLKPLDLLVPREDFQVGVGEFTQRIVTEESVVIEVAEELSSSVVTVSIKTPERTVLEYSPFGGFRSRTEGGQDLDIGSGFIVSEDGLIVTNKHVVDTDGAEYKVITGDELEYTVEEISKDPSNDIAVLKIDPSSGNGEKLKPVELGDSGNLKVGQFVIAIGTALGEFRHTVTTGVISGLGRGITAGSVYEGYVERLDGVIQTDAAINPGNSGGPLLNSAGQVIGVNVAVAQSAENIGFAIPIDIVKQGLDQFESTGKFVSKPFLGVEYQMITRRSAILNDVPEGAFIMRVVEGSPAEQAGVQVDDIITKMDGKDLSIDGTDLVEVISSKKPGEEVSLEIWRPDPEGEGDGEIINSSATLSEFSE